MNRPAATPREWAIALAGGLALAAGLVTVLRRESPLPGAPQARPVAANAPAPSVPAPPPVPGPAPVDLLLTGLRAGPDGGMAIIAVGKRQYILRPGRALPGGLRLVRVEPGQAVLAGPAGEMVLAFPDARPVATRPQPPGGDPTPWRLALQPVRGADGAIRGWRLDSLSGLPQLARAGLRVGDVLLSSGGNDLISEEKIIELPQTLAGAGRLDLTLRRGGKTLDVTVSS